MKMLKSLDARITVLYQPNCPHCEELMKLLSDAQVESVTYKLFDKSPDCIRMIITSGARKTPIVEIITGDSLESLTIEYLNPDYVSVKDMYEKILQYFEEI